MRKLALLGLFLAWTGASVTGQDTTVGAFRTKGRVREVRDGAKEKGSRYPLAYTADMTISLDWELPAESFETLRKWVIATNNLMFDLTEGQVRFNRVTIYDRKTRWDEVDVRVSTAPGVTPKVDGRTQMENGEVTHVLLGILLPDKFPGNIPLPAGFGHVPIFSDNGVHAFAHEASHYYFGLDDEYTKGRSCRCVMQGGQTTIGPDGKVQGVGSREMCIARDHGNSCWEVVKRRYPKVTVPEGEPKAGPDAATEPAIVLPWGCDTSRVEIAGPERKETCLKSVYACADHQEAPSLRPGKCPQEIVGGNPRAPARCGKNLELKETVGAEVVYVFECPKCFKRAAEKGKCAGCGKDLRRKRSCRNSGMFPHIDEEKWRKAQR